MKQEELNALTGFLKRVQDNFEYLDLINSNLYADKLIEDFRTTGMLLVDDFGTDNKELLYDASVAASDIIEHFCEHGTDEDSYIADRITELLAEQTHKIISHAQKWLTDNVRRYVGVCSFIEADENGKETCKVSATTNILLYEDFKRQMIKDLC